MVKRQKKIMESLFSQKLLLTHTQQQHWEEMENETGAHHWHEQYIFHYLSRCVQLEHRFSSEHCWFTARWALLSFNTRWLIMSLDWLPCDKHAYMSSLVIAVVRWQRKCDCTRLRLTLARDNWVLLQRNDFCCFHGTLMMLLRRSEL